MLTDKTSDSSLLSIYRDLFKRSLKMISILRTKWLYMDRKTSRKLLENVSGYKEVNKYFLIKLKIYAIAILFWILRNINIY